MTAPGRRWSPSPVIVQIDDEAMTLRDACARYSIPFTTAWGRLRKGWSAKRAVTTASRNQPGTLFKHATGYLRETGKRRLVHVEVAERALGKPLPAGAEVHHVNEIKHDNRPSNLVVCPDRAYHALLHRRARALDACGNAGWLRCEICGGWGEPSTMYVRKSKAGQWHRSCGNTARAERKKDARHAN